MDAYLPAPAPDAAPRPAVVVIPGGAWRRGGRIDLAEVAARIAGRGYAAFVVDYRRDDPRPFPGAVDDVARAFAFVRARAARFGIDRERVALLGTSAGGNLAALAGDDPRAVRIARGRPLAVVSWSGPMNLVDMAEDARSLTRCRIGPPWRSPGCTLSRSILARLPVWLGCPIDARAPWLSREPRPAPCPGVYRSGSPVARVSPRHPPTLLIHARGDRLVPVRQSRLMAGRLGRAGVGRLALIVPGRAHGADLADDALGPTLRFLSRR
ncbi:MAG: alpha/beta hydrolase [Miltoncostaeaceae bacterium]